MVGYSGATPVTTEPDRTLYTASCSASGPVSRITRKSAAELHLEPGSEVWAQVKSVALLD